MGHKYEPAAHKKRLVAVLCVVAFTVCVAGAWVTWDHMRWNKQPSHPANKSQSVWTSRNVATDGGNLRHDRFSLVVNVFRQERVPLLRELLQNYAKSTHLDAVFLIWSSDQPPPEKNFWGIVRPVHTITFEDDRLTNRFYPPPADKLRTVGVLIADDDIFVPAHDVDLVFAAFQQNEEHIVGIFPRGHVHNTNANEGGDSTAPPFLYRNLNDRYSVALTKFMFLHHRYLHEFTFNMNPRVRSYVNGINNCEDIAMNFLVSSITQRPPVIVGVQSRDYGDSRGYGHAVSAAKSVSLSSRGTHRDQRSECLQVLSAEFGGMMLRHSHMQIGRFDGEHTECFNGLDWLDCSLASSTPVKRKPNSKYAYVTVLADNDPVHVMVVACWAKRLRGLGTAHDTVLVMTDDVDFDEHFAQLMVFSRIKIVRRLVDNKGLGKVQFTKLHIWELDEYEKIIYLDFDILLLENIDDLFERPDITAVPDIYASHRFNSGLMVLRPNRELARLLIKNKDLIPSYNKGDQGLLNAFFGDWFARGPDHRLPFAYNFIKYFPDHYRPPAWFDIHTVEQFLGTPKVVHFANPWFKPWLFRNPESRSDPFIRMWWDTCSVDHNHTTTNTNTTATAETGGAFAKQTQSQNTKPAEQTTNSLHLQHVLPTIGYGFKVQGNVGFTATVDGDIYATYFNGHMENAVTWVSTLHSTGTHRRTLALVGDSVTLGEERFLKGLFDFVERVSTVQNPYNDDSFNILRLFGMTKFKRIVFVDSPSVFLENVDELFTRPSFTAVAATFPPDRFSALLFVVSPSTELYNDLIAAIPKLPSFDQTCAGFLNSFFSDWYKAPIAHRLEPSYHADMWLKPNFLKFLTPVKILWYDPRWRPSQDLDAFATSKETSRNLKAWWTLFCRGMTMVDDPDHVVKADCNWNWGSAVDKVISHAFTSNGNTEQMDPSELVDIDGDQQEDDPQFAKYRPAMMQEGDGQGKTKLDLDKLDSELFKPPKIRVKVRRRVRKGEEFKG